MDSVRFMPFTQLVLEFTCS